MRARTLKRAATQLGAIHRALQQRLPGDTQVVSVALRRGVGVQMVVVRYRLRRSPIQQIVTPLDTALRAPCEVDHLAALIEHAKREEQP